MYYFALINLILLIVSCQVVRPSTEKEEVKSEKPSVSPVLEQSGTPLIFYGANGSSAPAVASDSLSLYGERLLIQDARGDYSLFWKSSERWLALASQKPGNNESDPWYTLAGMSGSLKKSPVAILSLNKQYGKQDFRLGGHEFSVERRPRLIVRTGADQSLFFREMPQGSTFTVYGVNEADIRAVSWSAGDRLLNSSGFSVLQDVGSYRLDLLYAQGGTEQTFQYSVEVIGAGERPSAPATTPILALQYSYVGGETIYPLNIDQLTSVQQPLPQTLLIHPFSTSDAHSWSEDIDLNIINQTVNNVVAEGETNNVSVKKVDGGLWEVSSLLPRKKYAFSFSENGENIAQFDFTTENQMDATQEPAYCIVLDECEPEPLNAEEILYLSSSNTYHFFLNDSGNSGALWWWTDKSSGGLTVLSGEEIELREPTTGSYLLTLLADGSSMRREFPVVVDGISNVVIDFSTHDGEQLTAFELLDETTKRLTVTAKTQGELPDPYLEWVDQSADNKGRYSESYQLWLGADDGSKLGSWNPLSKGYDNDLEIDKPGKYRACVAVPLTEAVCSEPFYRLKFLIESVPQVDGDVPKLILDVDPPTENLNYRWESKNRQDQSITVGVGRELAVPLGEYRDLKVELWPNGLRQDSLFYDYEDFINIYDVAIGGSSLLDGSVSQALDFLGQKSFKLTVAFIDRTNSRVKWIRVKLAKDSAWLSLEENQQLGQRRKSLTLSPVVGELNNTFHAELYFRWDFESDYDNNQIQVELLDEKQRPIQKRFFTVLANNTPPPSPQLCAGVSSCREQGGVELFPEQEIEFYDIPTLFTVDDLEDGIVYGHADYLEGYKIINSASANEETISWSGDGYQAVVLSGLFNANNSSTLQLVPEITRNEQLVRLPAISYSLKRKTQPELELYSPYSEEKAAGLWYDAGGVWRRLNPEKEEVVRLGGEFLLIVYDPERKIVGTPSLQFSGSEISAQEEDYPQPWRRWSFMLEGFPDAQPNGLVTSIRWEGGSDSRTYSIVAQRDITLTQEVYGADFVFKNKVYWGLQPFRFEFDDPNRLIKSFDVIEKNGIAFSDREDGPCTLDAVQNKGSANPAFCANFQLLDDAVATFVLVAKDGEDDEVFRKEYSLSSLWSDATWWVFSGDKRLDNADAQLRIGDTLTFKGEVNFPDLDEQLIPRVLDEGGNGAPYVVKWCYSGGDCDESGGENYTLSKNARQQLSFEISYGNNFVKTVSFEKPIQHVARVAYDEEFWRIENKGDAAIAKYSGEIERPPLLSGSLESDQELIFDENGLNDLPKEGPSGSTLSYSLYQGASFDEATRIADSWDRDDGWKMSGSGAWKTLSKDWLGQKIFLLVEYQTRGGALVKFLLSSRATIMRYNNPPSWSVGGRQVEDGLSASPLEEDQALRVSLADTDRAGEEAVTYRWLRYEDVQVESPPKYFETSNLWKELHRGDTYTLQQNEVNSFVAVEASYTEYDGKTELVYLYFNNKVKNVNDTPEGEILGLSSSGKARQFDTLELFFKDDDGEPRNARYQWLRGTVLVGENSTYTVQQDDVGRALTAKVNYVDTFDTREEFSSEVQTIENVFPSVRIQVQDPLSSSAFIERKNDKVRLLVGQNYQFSFGGSDVTNQHTGIGYQWSLKERETEQASSGSLEFERRFPKEGSYTLSLTFTEDGETRVEKLEIEVLNFNWQGGDIEGDWRFAFRDDLNQMQNINGLENAISVSSPFASVKYLAFKDTYYWLDSGSWGKVGEGYWRLMDLNTDNPVGNSISLEARVGKAKLQFLRKGSYRISVDLLDQVQGVLATRYLYLTALAGAQDVLVLSEKDQATTVTSDTFEDVLASYNENTLSSRQYSFFLSRSPDNNNHPTPLQVYGHDNRFTLYLSPSYHGKSYQFFEDEGRRTLARSLQRSKGVFQAEGGLVSLPLNFRFQGAPSKPHELILQVYDQESSSQPSLLVTEVPFHIEWLNEAQVGFAQLDAEGDPTGEIVVGSSSATELLQFKLDSSNGSPFAESSVRWEYRLKEDEQELVYNSQLKNWGEAQWSLANNLGFVFLESPSLPEGKYFVQAQAVDLTTLNDDVRRIRAMSDWTQLEYVSEQPKVNSYFPGNINLNKSNPRMDVVIVFDQEVSVEEFSSQQISGLSISSPLAVDERVVRVGENLSRYQRLTLEYVGEQPLKSVKPLLTLTVANRTNKESVIEYGNLEINADIVVPELEMVTTVSGEEELAAGSTLVIGQSLSVGIETSEEVSFDIENDNSNRPLIANSEGENSYSISYTVAEGDRTTSTFNIRGSIEDVLGNKKEVDLPIPVGIDASRPKLQEITISREYFEATGEEAIFKLFFSEPVALVKRNGEVLQPERSVQGEYLEELAQQILLINSNGGSVPLGELFELSWTDESNFDNTLEVINFTISSKESRERFFTRLRLPQYQDRAGNPPDSSSSNEREIRLNIAQAPGSTVERPQRTQIKWSDNFLEDGESFFYTSQERWTPEFLAATGVERVEYCLGENCFNDSTNIKTASAPTGFVLSGEELSFSEEGTYGFYYRNEGDNAAARVSLVYDTTLPSWEVEFETFFSESGTRVYPLKPDKSLALQLQFDTPAERAFYHYQLDRGDSYASGVWRPFSEEENGLLDPDSLPSLEINSEGYLGRYRLRVRLTDRAGNEDSQTYLLNFEDRPPFVENVAFTDVYNNENIAITFSEEVRYPLGAAITLTSNTLPLDVTNHDGKTYDLKPDFAAYREEGNFTLTIDYIDLAGNSNSYRRMFPIDRRAPEIEERQMRAQVNDACAGELIPLGSNSIIIGRSGFCIDFNVNLESTYSQVAGSAAFTLKEGQRIIESGARLKPDTVYTLVWKPSPTLPGSAARALTFAAGSLKSNNGSLSVEKSWNVEIQDASPVVTPSFESLGENAFQWVLNFDHPVKLTSSLDHNWLGDSNISQEIVTVSNEKFSQTYFYRFSMNGVNRGSLTLTIPEGGFRDRLENPVEGFSITENNLPTEPTTLAPINANLSLNFYNKQGQVTLQFNRRIERFLLDSAEVSLSRPEPITCSTGFCYRTNLTAKGGHAGEIKIDVGFTDEFGNSKSIESVIGSIDTQKSQLTFGEMTFTPSTPTQEPELKLEFSMDNNSNVSIDTDVAWIQFNDLLEGVPSLENQTAENAIEYAITFPLKRDIDKIVERFYFPDGFFKYDVGGGNKTAHNKNVIFENSSVFDSEKKIDTFLKEPKTENNYQELNPSIKEITFPILFDEPVTLSELQTNIEAVPIQFAIVDGVGQESLEHVLKLSLPPTIDFSNYESASPFTPSFTATDALGNERKIILDGWRFQPKKTSPPVVELAGGNDADTLDLQGGRFVVAKVSSADDEKSFTLLGAAVIVTSSSLNEVQSFNNFIPAGGQQNLLIPIQSNTRGEYRLRVAFEDDAGNRSEETEKNFSVDLTVPTLELEKDSLEINTLTLEEVRRGEQPQLELYASEEVNITVKLSDSLQGLIDPPEIKSEGSGDGYTYSFRLALDETKVDKKEVTGYLELHYDDDLGNRGEVKLLSIDIDTQKPEETSDTDSSSEPLVVDDFSVNYVDLSFEFTESVQPLKGEYLKVRKEDNGQLQSIADEGRFDFLQRANNNVQQVRYYPPEGAGILRVNLEQAYDLAENPLNAPVFFRVEYDLEKPEFLGSIFPTEKTNATFDFYLAFDEEIDEERPLAVTNGNISPGNLVSDPTLKRQLLDQEGISPEAVLYRYFYVSDQEVDGTVEFSLLPYSDLSGNISQESLGSLKTMSIDVTPPSLNSSKLAGSDPFVTQGVAKKILFNFSEEVKSITFNGVDLFGSSEPILTREGFSYTYSYTAPEDMEGEVDIRVVSFEDLSGNSTETAQSDIVTLFYDTKKPELLGMSFTVLTSGSEVSRINRSNTLLEDGNVQEFALDFIFDEAVFDPGYNINFSGGFLKSYQAITANLNNNGVLSYRYRYVYVPYLNLEKQEITFSLNEFSDFFTDNTGNMLVANTVSQPLQTIKVTLDTQAPAAPVIKGFFDDEDPPQTVENNSSTNKARLNLTVDIGKSQTGTLILKNTFTEELSSVILEEGSGSFISFTDLEQQDSFTSLTQTNTYQAWLVDELGNESPLSQAVNIYFDAEEPEEPKVESFEKGVLRLSNYKLNDVLHYRIGNDTSEERINPSAEILLLPQMNYQAGDVELWYVDAAGNQGESIFWPNGEQSVDTISARFLDSASPYITVARQQDRNASGYFFAPMYAVVDHEKEWEYSLNAGKTWQKGNEEGFFNVPTNDGGFLPTYVQVRQENLLWLNSEPVLVLDWALVRIAVSWDTFADLDAHLYVPEPNSLQIPQNIGYENPINHNNNRFNSLDQLGQQDRSELNFYGPETFSIGRLIPEESYFLLVEAHNNSWDFDYRRTASGSLQAQEEYKRLEGTDEVWRTMSSEIEKYGTLAQVYISFQLTQGRRLSRLFEVPYPMVYHSADKECDSILYGQNSPSAVSSNWQEERFENNIFRIPAVNQKREWRALSFSVKNLNLEGQVASAADLEIADNWSALSSDIDVSIRTIKNCE